MLARAIDDQQTLVEDVAAEQDVHTRYRLPQLNDGLHGLHQTWSRHTGGVGNGQAHGIDVYVHGAARGERRCPSRGAKASCRRTPDATLVTSLPVSIRPRV